SKQVDVALGATIPGVLSTTLAIAIGEPPQSSPWLAVGEAGTVVRTAQTRIKLLVTVGVGNPNLGGGISLLSVKLPLNVEVAYAEAKLTDISCPTGPDSLKVTIAAKPGIAAVNLAASDADNSPTAFADFSNPQSFSDANIADVSLNLLLLKIPLILVKGSAGADITNVSPTNLVFNKTEIAAKTIKTTPTRDITQTLTTSLVDKLSLSVNALGILGLDITALLGTVKPAVTTLLKTVTAPVDTLLYNLLDTLGVHLGEADVRVTGATCGRAVLVQ
ncbi:hypothetical protein EOB77_31035, partial [Mesorhizobium sp. M7A.F.Ca.MR.228.00.0.0]